MPGRYTYFVSYHFATPIVHGFSSASVTITQPLETFEQILAVQKMIEDDRTDGATVVLLYWKALAS